MISNKCKYALRALMFLAVNSDKGQKINIIDIGDELKIPIPYLRKILQELVPKGIISSSKGPNGGFYMTTKNLNIPLISVVEAIDGLQLFESCGLGLAKCSEDHPCPFHKDFKIIRERLKSLFVNNTLANLAHQIENSNLLLVN